MACANIVPEILRIRTYSNIKWHLMQKQSTPKNKQKSLLFVICLHSRTERNPKSRAYGFPKNNKDNYIRIPKPILEGASLRNARNDYSEWRAAVRRCFVRNAGSKDESIGF